ncbi:MAG: hypothetical protein RLY70_4507 [Planctomycetota bacterium]
MPRHHRANAALVLAGLLCLLSACERAKSSARTPTTATPRDTTPRDTTSRDTTSRDTTSSATTSSATTSSDTDWFEDATPASGIEFTYRTGVEGNQFTILETVGGGVAFIDYDSDGDQDLFFPGGGMIGTTMPGSSRAPLSTSSESIAATSTGSTSTSRTSTGSTSTSRTSTGSTSRGETARGETSRRPAVTIDGAAPGLFRNEGGWRFTPVSYPARLAGPAIATSDYTHGATVADYNCDGFADLFVTAYGRCRLYQNRGDGTFDDVSDGSGATFAGWSTAAAWGDVNGDGFPDVYVAQYLDWSLERDSVCHDSRGQRDVCPPQQYSPAADRLLLNCGNGEFRDGTKEAALRGDGRALGVVAADINGDGRIDFYVANDAGANYLYLGAASFPLADSALTAGVAYQEFGLPEGSMGVDLGDYNGDGRADLWVTNFELEDNSLYQAEASGLFRHATVAAGLAGSCFSQVGFGTGMEDLDGDGRLDLFVLNGHVYYGGGQTSYAQPAFLFRNRDGRRFENVTARGGRYFAIPHPGRGAAVGDLDNDGDLDLVMVHQNEPVALLRNRRGSTAWLRLRLRGATQNPDAIGATVRAMAGEQVWTRFVRSGAGYLSQFDPRILLPAPQPLDIEVAWPGGRRELFPQLAPGRTHDLLEGTGQPTTSPTAVTPSRPAP